ncbi:MAG: hypothetical protein KAT34_17920 [Candidatus Aminicenantes bacterium]|jgi:hypothetical protein|nr:hypothetical protein [Candidatus Aminicenantes bacterium]
MDDDFDGNFKGNYGVDKGIDLCYIKLLIKKKWIGYNVKEGGYKWYKKRFVWGSTIIPMKAAI